MCPIEGDGQMWLVAKNLTDPRSARGARTHFHEHPYAVGVGTFHRRIEHRRCTRLREQVRRAPVRRRCERGI
jgi:hypothetical protein